jgi:hypothetical protein
LSQDNLEQRDQDYREGFGRDNDGVIFGQGWASVLDLLDAPSNGTTPTGVMGLEKLRQCVRASSLSRFDIAKLLDEGTENEGVFIFKPIEYLWKIGLERCGNAISQANLFSYQHASGFDPLT